MKFSAILLCAALYFASSIKAGITTGTPFKSVTWNGGETEKVSWSDDGTAPKLKDIGITSIDLMAGGSLNQVFVANIAKVPATVEEVEYKVPAKIGPPGNFYFIKYTAGTYTSFSGSFSIAKVNGNIKGFDPKNPNVPPQGAVGKNATANPNYPPPSLPSTTGGPASAAPAAPATPATPPANSSPSNNGATSLFPSLAGVTTSAVALALTYLI